MNGWLAPLRAAWEGLQERLIFLPPFPDQLDTLALFSLLLVVGLLVGEWLRTRWGWPRVLGYVLAGTFFGPAMLGWIDFAALAQMRPLADAAHGLLLMEIGRRLDIRWLFRNWVLMRGTLSDIVFSFLAIFVFSYAVAGLTPAWAAATAAVTMASAPAVVLLVIEEANGQGQVSERIILHTALGSAAAFIVFAVVLGVVHAQYSADWLNALVHPLWVALGAALIAWLMSWLALVLARRLPKGSLAQVFVLVAAALLAVGVARMLSVPIFLTLFLTGAVLAYRDADKTLSYTNLPEGHWLLAIILFVVVGASLPWQDFTWLTGLQALGLLVVRAGAKLLAPALAGGSLPMEKRLLVGVGIQPLSATAIFMAFELASLYPEIGRSALTLAFFAAALMEIVGPLLCRFAITRAGEAAGEGNEGRNVL
ncbi:cation:proton antiporter [Propionivibrio limicola]|uniref:cation:proton antiporter domain-containing protein n=1 Tax=Propionivibrio limicola TaxID=167645 RepID=UPI001479215A|nr:cation:proton antiporter [Propionivibrio limicola]